MTCGHESPRPGCPFCRAVQSGSRYADLFRNPPPAAAPGLAGARPPAVSEASLPCPHRGAVVEWGGSCCSGHGNVYDCDVFERCVLTVVPGQTRPGVAACDACDRRPR